MRTMCPIMRPYNGRGRFEFIMEMYSGVAGPGRRSTVDERNMKTRRYAAGRVRTRTITRRRRSS